MTNRDLILMKLIQLSPEDFAELMNDQISELMGGKLCELCMASNHGECLSENAAVPDGCKFDLAAWLQEKISNDEMIAAANA